MTEVITRFPPSPTGFLHIGSVRTALFNYLFAAHEGGTMYLRFEDTDKARSKKEFEEDILDGLAWLGIPYKRCAQMRQSENTEAYREHLARLLSSGAAYEAEEASDGSGKKVIRFKNPGSTILFNDMIRGEISFETAELGDFVIAKGADEPLYHLAVVVDDHDTGVTHVIRGEDHISNTPRQILILEALGFPRPVYAHIPLILAPNRSKLSKRHGAVSVTEYRSAGFLPDALLNYLALLGWNPGTEQEIFSREELVRLFDVSRIHKGGAIFDIEKLRWFNREYLARLSENDFSVYMLPTFEECMRARGAWDARVGSALVPLVRQNISTLDDVRNACAAGEYDFFFTPPQIGDGARLLHKEQTPIEASAHLGHLFETLAALSEFSAEDIKAAIWEYASEHGKGAVLWPFRLALSGKDKSPDPFLIAEMVGKEETLSRIQAANALLTTIT